MVDVTPEQLEQEINKVFNVDFKLETFISHIETVIAQYEGGSSTEPQPCNDLNTQPHRHSSEMKKLPTINLP